MSGPLVSVIVPVYNVELFLAECLDSVVGQTLRDIEIVCVNDASTDGSLAILHQYAARDPRVRVIDKPTNEGLSVTRNVGMAAATGRYLLFVDSDDFVDTDLCRKAYECAEHAVADLVIYDFAEFWTKEELGGKRRQPSRLEGIDLTNKAALLALNAYAWTKLVRASHVRALGLQFPDGLTYEDQPFHWALLTRTDRVALLPERLCFYRQRQGSIGYRTDLSRADYILVGDLVREFLVQSGLYRDYRDLFIRHRLQTFRVVHDTIERRHRPTVRQMVGDRMDDDHWEAVRADRALARTARDFLLAMDGNLLAKTRRSLWLVARQCYRLCGRPTLTSRRSTRGDSAVR